MSRRRAGQLCDCGRDLSGPVCTIDQQCRTAVKAALWKKTVESPGNTCCDCLWGPRRKQCCLTRVTHSRLLPVVSYITEARHVRIWFEQGVHRQKAWSLLFLKHRSCLKHGNVSPECELAGTDGSKHLDLNPPRVNCFLFSLTQTQTNTMATGFPCLGVKKSSRGAMRACPWRVSPS